MLDTILQSVGHTPLVKLNRLTEGLAATVAIKVESSNPGGSVKDRVAMSMISEAERRGLLRHGWHHHRSHRGKYRCWVGDGCSG